MPPLIDMSDGVLEEVQAMSTFDKTKIESLTDDQVARLQSIDGTAYSESLSCREDTHCIGVVLAKLGDHGRDEDAIDPDLVDRRTLRGLGYLIQNLAETAEQMDYISNCVDTVRQQQCSIHRMDSFGEVFPIPKAGKGGGAVKVESKTKPKE